MRQKERLSQLCKTEGLRKKRIDAGMRMDSSARHPSQKPARKKHERRQRQLRPSGDPTPQRKFRLFLDRPSTQNDRDPLAFTLQIKLSLFARGSLEHDRITELVEETTHYCAT